MRHQESRRQNDKVGGHLNLNGMILFPQTLLILQPVENTAVLVPGPDLGRQLEVLQRQLYQAGLI